MKPRRHPYLPLVAWLVIAVAIALPDSVRAADSPCTLMYSQILMNGPACAYSPGNQAYVTGSWAGATYVWEITNGTIDSGQGTRSIVFTAGGGLVGLKVTIHAPSCPLPMIDTRMVTVLPLTEVRVATPAAVCPGSRHNPASVIDPGSEIYSLWTIRNGSILEWNDTLTEVEFLAGWSGQVELSTRPAIGCWLAVPAVVPILPTSTGPIEAQNACAFSAGNVASVPDAGPGATYSWSVEYGASITSPQPHSSAISFTAGATGDALLRVKVDTPDGCSLEFSKLIRILSVPEVSIVAPALICSGSQDNFAAVGDAGPGSVYAWTIENGSIVSSSHSSPNIQFTADRETSLVILGVTVQTPAGCANSSTFDVAVNPTPSAAIETGPACARSTGNRASVADAGPRATYEWLISNGLITSAKPHARVIEYTAGEGPDPVTLQATVRSAAQCRDTRTASIAVENCDEFCSLTQRFYGSEEVQFNSEGVEALINRLLPLSVGVAGRSLTIPAGGARCVLELLPASGRPTPLLAGEQIAGPTSCDTMEPTEGDGRLRNRLLGEMIALTLNAKLHDHKLLAAPLCTALQTRPALAGIGGLYGDSDDRPHPGADGVRGPNCAIDPLLCPDDDPVGVHSIHAAVLHALDEWGLPHTGSGLLELGNRALGGHSVRGVSLEAIQSAVASFNQAWAECRFLFGCVEPDSARRRPASRGGGSQHRR